MVHIGCVVARAAVGGAEVGVGRARVVVNPVPAGGQCRGRAPGVEVLHKGQRLCHAGRVDVYNGAHRVGACRAVGREPHLVVGVGCQLGEGVVVVGAVGVLHNPASGVAHAVLHAPRALLVARRPRHRGLGGRAVGYVGCGGEAGDGAVARHQKAHVGLVLLAAARAGGHAVGVEGGAAAVVVHAHIVGCRRAVAVEVRVAVARPRRLVHDGGEHQVRAAVPVERAVEPIAHRARRAYGVGAAVVAVGGVNAVPVAAAGSGEAAAPCGVEVYVQALGVARVARPLHGAARNVACRQSHAAQLRGGVDSLAEGVARAVVHRAVGGVRLGARGVAVASAEAARGEGGALPVGVRAVVAHAAHPHRVGGQGVEAAKEVPVGGVGQRHGAAHAGLFYLQLVVGGQRYSAYPAPCNHGGGARGPVGAQVAYRRAGG